MVGGVVSGSLNYFSMKPMAKRLKNELRKGLDYSEENLKEDLIILQDEEVTITDSNSSKSMVEDENLIEQIEKAYELLKQKIITEEEFMVIKKRLLSK